MRVPAAKKEKEEKTGREGGKDWQEPHVAAGLFAHGGQCVLPSEEREVERKPGRVKCQWA